MLQLLIFPDLDFQKETSINTGTPQAKHSNLYKLNWEWSDNYKKKKWLQFQKEHQFSKNKFMELPEPYNQVVKDSLFFISEHYRSEIIRNFAEATKEWALIRTSFDTTIREMCLDPAISHIQVGFNLIADCLYDEEKNYYDRTELAQIISNMLLYKFWCMQTGNGMVRYHSGINNMNEAEMATKLLIAINKYESDLNG